jgi:hypothetical protein
MAVTSPSSTTAGGGDNTSRIFLDFSSRSSASWSQQHHQEVSLVLKPVPLRSSNNKPSPADSVKTLVNESLPEIQVSTNEEAATAGARFSAVDLSRRMSPRPLQRLRDDEEQVSGGRSLLASSSLSLPPETAVNSAASRLSAFNSDMRSKTDNLERLISEVERSSANSLSGGLGGREVKKYIRRRYTDSRHPTTELPDVRGEEPLPSVQNPPLRDAELGIELKDHLHPLILGLL